MLVGSKAHIGEVGRRAAILRVGRYCKGLRVPASSPGTQVRYIGVLGLPHLKPLHQNAEAQVVVKLLIIF